MSKTGNIRALERDLKMRSVAVVGAGLSGKAAARLLVALGASVQLLDDRKQALQEAPTGVSTGHLSADALQDVDLVVLSPGVPRSRPELTEVIKAQRLVGEVELASWFISTPMVGITGTNGKSTTTALAGHMAELAGHRVFLGGNFGTPLSELALMELGAETPAADIAFVELSSYQLESISELSLQAGVWLNIQPDHLDRYPTFEAYAESKAQIFAAVASGGVAVASMTDPTVRSYGQQAAQRGDDVRWIAVGHPLEKGCLGTAVQNEQAHRGQEVYELGSDGLRGQHNHENAAFAIEVCRGLGVPPAAVQAGLDSFCPLGHRLSVVHAADELVWFNDSKATNISAAVTAVKAMDRPTHLIVGGRDKGGSWQPLVQAALGRVVRIHAIGEAMNKVSEAFEGRLPVERSNNLTEAVGRIRELAQPGESVLLAPACGSQDQFKNYKERGELFIRLARGERL